MKAKRRAPRARRAGLNGKQARFVREYLVDFCAAEAARRAGYSGKHAKRVGWALLRNPEVQAEIEKHNRRSLGTLEVTLDRFLLEAARLALFDPRIVLDARGDVLPLAAWPHDAAACLSSFDMEIVPTGQKDAEGNDILRTRLKKVRFHSKNEALDKVLRHLGAYLLDNMQKGVVQRALDVMAPAQLEALVAKLESLGVSPDNARDAA